MSICGACCRRKRVDEHSLQESKLAKVLTTFDLTALGVGSTLGVGIYVLAGEVAKTTAGPAVVISFLIAAITSVFAGLCFAEFGARVPKAGSAYAYSYYCVGELTAFVIGWNLILEYVIGAASVARGISTYIDSMADNQINKTFSEWAPMHADFLSPYFDFFAFFLCILLSFSLAFGVKESTIVNNIFTTVNVGVVLFVIISGFFNAKIEYWQIAKEDIPEDMNGGEGGFAPFGALGIIKGAAICFYGFVGFDCIATTGEEVKNPQKAIPIGILSSLFIVFLAYFGISTVLTLMLPYYLQDKDAPIPYVYEVIGWNGARWVIAIGALFGLFSSLFGAMFPLPRIVYAMANDGLIFKFLGNVHPKYQTPLIGTLFAGLVTALMAAFFDLQQLISMMALGTLLAYTIVAICVLVLRYIPDSTDEEDNHEVGENTSLVNKRVKLGLRELSLGYFNFKLLETPTALTGRVVTVNIFLYSLLSLGLGLLFVHLSHEISVGESGSITGIVILVLLMLLVMCSIAAQPKSKKSLPFKMPLVPLLPCLSIFINIYLMVVLDGLTWIRFAVWMAVGFIPYFTWYIWKYFHNETGKYSKYEIHRLNAVKLNQSIWKIMESKRIASKGFENFAFNENEIFNEAVVDNISFSSEKVGNIHNELNDTTEANLNVSCLETKEVLTAANSPGESHDADLNNNTQDVVGNVDNKDATEVQLQEHNKDVENDLENLVNESYGFLLEMKDESKIQVNDKNEEDIQREERKIDSEINEEKEEKLVKEEVEKEEEKEQLQRQEVVEEPDEIIEVSENFNIAQNPKSVQSEEEKTEENVRNAEKHAPSYKKEEVEVNKSTTKIIQIPLLRNKKTIDLEKTYFQKIRDSNGGDTKVKDVDSQSIQGSEVKVSVVKSSITTLNEKEKLNSDGYISGSDVKSKIEQMKSLFSINDPSSRRSTSERKRGTSEAVLKSVEKWRTSAQIASNPSNKHLGRSSNEEESKNLAKQLEDSFVPITIRQNGKAPVFRSNSRLSQKYLDSIKKVNENTGYLKEAKSEESKGLEPIKVDEVNSLESDKNPIPKPPPLPTTTTERPKIFELMKQIQNPPKLRHMEKEEKERVSKPYSFREKLNQILQSQISLQNTTLPRSNAPKPEYDIDDIPWDETEDDDFEKSEIDRTIKTLSKVAMRNKLEFILAKGPPKRASFRNSFEIESKRKETVAALREIEVQAMEGNKMDNQNGKEKKNMDPREFENESEITRRQRMLMGNVLSTIKLKDKLKAEDFR